MFAITVILTFFISGLVTSSCFDRFLNRKQILNTAEILLSGFICGPLIISVILALLFYLFPQKSNSFYITAVIILFVGTAAYLYKDCLKKCHYLKQVSLASLSFKKHLFFKLFALALTVHILYQGVCLPIVTNDALLYSSIGRYLVAEKSFANYPMKTPDKATGAFYPWVDHPPGLLSLYSWLNLLTGTKADHQCRAVAPIYALYLLMLLFYITKKHSNIIAAQLTTVIYAFTPVFSFQALGNTIDPIRTCLMLLTFYLLYKLTQNMSSLPTIILTGLSIFLALFIHLANFLILPVAGLIFLFFHPWIKYKKTFLLLLVLAGIGLQYYVWDEKPHTNKFLYLMSLNPTHNINAIRRRQAFGEEWQQRVAAKKVSFLGVFWHERLQIYSAVTRFGLTFYIGTLGIIWFFIHKRKRKLSILFLGLIFFMGIPLITKYFINYRYIATLCPQFIYFGAIFISAILLALKAKKINLLPLYRLSLFFVFIIFTATLATGIVFNDFSNFKSYGTVKQNWLKFASWKQFTNPMALLTNQASKQKTSQTPLYITSERILPEHYYYYAPSPIYRLQDNEPLNTLIKQGKMQHLSNTISKDKTSFILATPAYNDTFSNFDKQSGVQLLQKHRDYNLYKISQ